MSSFDAIVVPGGGVTDQGQPPPWVVARLQRALERCGEATILTLSAGTTHKPPPRDAEGFPLLESVAGARWLVQHGADPRRLATETCSLDTIGNAYFSRTAHAEPRGWRRLLVVTSEFHRPRAEAIFRAVYALPSGSGNPFGFVLEFESTPDVGLAANELADRRAKEANDLADWQAKAARFRTLGELHAWLFAEHGAYAPGLRARRATGTVLGSY